MTIDEIRKAHSEWRLVDMLAQTRLTGKVLDAVIETISVHGWQMVDVIEKLQKSMQVLENRNRKIAQKWVDALHKDL